MIRRRRPLRSAVLLLALAACSSPTGIGFEPDAYAPIPALESLDFGTVSPAESWDRWELRFKSGGPVDGLVGGGGPLERDDLPTEVRAAFVTASTPAGWPCGMICPRYLAAVRDGTVSTVADREALRAFLGPRESLAEAVMVIDAYGFYWDVGADTGWREVDDGWEFVVFERVQDCAPIVVDRVRVRLGVAGAPAEVEREEWDRMEDACI